MDTPHIDFLSILIAAALNIIIGSVWYSRFLFGKMEDSTHKPHKFAFLWNCVVIVITAAVLGFFEAFLGVTTVSDGMFVGFLAWLGFVATTQMYAVIWGKMSVKHFLLHSGCQLLSFLVMGGVIGA
jgi:hypothetical protein